MRPTGLRFGVEEEFLLVDPELGTTVPAAAEVLALARRRLGGRAQSEFFTTQVEACTRPVTTASALRAELVASRTALAEAADAVGCRVVATATSVLPSRHPLPVTPTPRYRRVAAHVGAVADQLGGELCGCHVHVGDLARAEALAVSAALRPWLPVLQAVCANSPYCEGTDSGADSTRHGRYAAWATYGPPPVLDEAGYERTARRLVAERVILDRKMIYWFARPSEHLPTLEVRVADTMADLDTVVLLACLLRGLVAVLSDGPGTAWCPTAPQLAEAHRQAARHGLAARCPDPRTGARGPVPELLEGLLATAGPGLDRYGDRPLAQALAERLLTTGTGAARQRAALARRGSLRDVVADLADRTTAALVPVVG